MREKGKKKYCVVVTTCDNFPTLRVHVIGYPSKPTILPRAWYYQVAQTEVEGWFWWSYPKY